MSVDPSVELLDEGPDDVEEAVIAWLRPLLPDGQVADARRAGDPLPFIEVSHLSGEERVELSCVDELVSIHCLYPRGDGNANRGAAAQFTADVHRRMLLLSRYLEDVVVDGRTLDVEYCDVAMRPRWVAYGDEQILQKIGRYRMGLGYAKMS